MEKFQAGGKAAIKYNFPRRFQIGWKKYNPFFWKQSEKANFPLHPGVHLKVYLRVQPKVNPRMYLRERKKKNVAIHTST